MYRTDTKRNTRKVLPNCFGGSISKAVTKQERKLLEGILFASKAVRFSAMEYYETLNDQTSKFHSVIFSFLDLLGEINRKLEEQLT
jgi:hypothetical protein